MPASWPTVEDVRPLMDMTALVVPDSVLQASLQAGVTIFERGTGYKPYIAEGSTSDQYASPNDCLGGLLRLPVACYTVTAVRVGLSSTDTTGTLLVENEGYWLEPLGSDHVNYIRLNALPSGGWRSIKVTGRKGRALTVPDDAWAAIVNYAIARGQSLVTGGASDISQGPVSIKYGGSSAQALAEKELAAAIARHKRP